jgi:hypothetical protein
MKPVIRAANSLTRWGAFLFVGSLLRMVMAALSLCAIVYYAFTEQWLAAIFFLLARQQVLKWADGILMWLDKKAAEAVVKAADAKKLAYSPMDENL